MARRRDTGVRSGLAVEVVEHLEGWCGRLEAFEAARHDDLAAAAGRQRDAVRAKLARLAAGEPVTVEGCLVRRPTEGACVLSADGDVSPV